MGARRLNRNQQSLLAAVARTERATHYLSIQTGPELGLLGVGPWRGREGRWGEAEPRGPEMHYSYVALTGLVIILNHYRVWSPNF